MVILLPMSNEPQSKPGEPPKQLIVAIQRLLRPLVRLMLSHQITYPYLIGLLKSLYVDVAEEDFQVNGKRQSDSRINLLTGIHRKDVKRLRSDVKVTSEVPENISTGAQLIGQWLGSAEFTDDKDKPLALSVKPMPNSKPGFDELVQKVCKQDIRPKVILDEWLRLGIAHIEDGYVILNTGAFTPQKGFDEKAFFFGKNLQDHISASSENLLENKPPYFDRSVYYDKLSEESVHELSELADTLGMRALTEMNKAALSRQHKDEKQAQSNHRINFGVFNYSEASEKTADFENTEKQSKTKL